MRTLIDFFKIFISFFLSIVIRKYCDYWFISERGVDARDNGYFFYKYLNHSHRDIKKLYCISSDSADFNRFTNRNEIVEPNSIKHGVVYFSSKYVISTHPYGIRPKWRGLDYLEKNKILHIKGKRIFLQHGITKDYIEGLTAKRLDLDLFCCGAFPEYEYVKKNFGYDDDIVQYTGLARFDNLYGRKKDVKQFILLMPTWRTFYRGITNEDDFKKTRYYKEYNNLLSNKKLVDFLEANDLNLVFYPHYEIQKWVHLFKAYSNRVKIASMEKYDVQELLIGCKALITDYSSVFFDVSYMKKPILFFQFDYEKYRETSYKQGYFDYSRGLGPVAKDSNTLIRLLSNSIRFGLDEKFYIKSNNYFKYRDKNNCNRIYKEIIKLR